ncbi:septum formation inhibitor Maf [Ectothiorhodospiraceae bacterium 2226]|nr:septum formation inhibitor Maf [Ectothiorhodospiraceae bacterium 2226]
MEPFDVYLASNSPRRRELLVQIGVRFHVLAVEVDERARAGERPEALVARLALAKARAGMALLPAGERRPVLGADTLVAVDGEVLGKPRDEAQGLDMLARLSGRTHRVLSAVALAGHAGEGVRVSENAVTFRPLTPEERVAYWQSGEPADKAGAYAIQGKAALFVTRLEGSYSGVMGLPLFETGELLRGAGLRLFGGQE